MSPKHFLQLKDFSRDELDYLFARTRWIKDRFKRYEIYQPLRDRTLAMVFEKLGAKTGEPPPYLSSHPVSSERIARINAAER